jgi:hypothetical protein
MSGLCGLTFCSSDFTFRISTCCLSNMLDDVTDDMEELTLSCSSRFLLLTFRATAQASGTDPVATGTVVTDPRSERIALASGSGVAKVPEVLVSPNDESNAASGENPVGCIAGSSHCLLAVRTT